MDNFCPLCSGLQLLPGFLFLERGFMKEVQAVFDFAKPLEQELPKSLPQYQLDIVGGNGYNKRKIARMIARAIYEQTIAKYPEDSKQVAKNTVVE